MTSRHSPHPEAPSRRPVASAPSPCPVASAPSRRPVAGAPSRRPVAGASAQRSQFVRPRRAAAWLAVAALAATSVAVVPQAAGSPLAAAEVDQPVGSLAAAAIDVISYTNNPFTATTAGSGFDLVSPWLPAGASAGGGNGTLWAGGIGYAPGSQGTFVGSWTPNAATGLIDSAQGTLATAYQNLPDNTSSRVIAIDNGRGPALYTWSSDSTDYWQTASRHPAEFAAGSLGTDPVTGSSCQPTTWGSANHGSWVAVRAYRAGETSGTALWVPNPRAGDVMSAYDALHQYPGDYVTGRDPSWPCVSAAGQWDDGWAAGQVIDATGEIFFASRGGLTTTFRAMIANPATGAFAESGLLAPGGPQDDLFEEANAVVASGLAVDAAGNGYVVVRGKAPAGSPWADPALPGAWAAYLVMIQPTLNPAYDASDPASLPYLHNGRWTYHVIERLLPAPGASQDVVKAFQPATCAAMTCVQIQNGSGLALVGGQLYMAIDKVLYRIDTATSAVYSVPQGAAGTPVTMNGTAVSIRSLAQVAPQVAPAPRLKVTPGEASLPAAGGNVTFTVTSPDSWTLSGLPNWIHFATPDCALSTPPNCPVTVPELMRNPPVDPYTGMTTLIVDRTTVVSPRQAILTISSGSDVTTFTVDQAGDPNAFWTQLIAQLRTVFAKLMALISQLFGVVGA